MLFLSPMLFGKNRAPLVNLTGGTIADAQLSPGASTAGININNDGTVDAFTTTGGVVQINADTDWVLPNSAAPSDYEVRLTVSAGSAPTTGPAVNTWHALTTSREWRLTFPGGGPGTDTGTWLIEIRRSGGSVIDSGSYLIDVEST